MVLSFFVVPGDHVDRKDYTKGAWNRSAQRVGNHFDYESRGEGDQFHWLVLSKSTGLSFLERLDISEASRISIRISLEILSKVYEKKEHLTKEIFYAGKPFEKEVKLLISIKGITPLSALAFLSDVGDVCRFQDNEKNERLSWPCSKAEGKR